MSGARRRFPRGLLPNLGLVSTPVLHSGSRSPTQRLRSLVRRRCLLGSSPPGPTWTYIRGAGVMGSPVAPPGVEHELSHAEAEPRARRRHPWGRGHSCRSWHRELPDAAL
jgi:hypothetical protein